MEQERIEYLKSNFGTVEYFEGSLEGFPRSWKDWFLLEISPRPPIEEIEYVAADIDNDINVIVGEGGRLFHSDSCNSEEHYLSKIVQDSLLKIPDTTFKVAVFKGDPCILKGQPIAIPLEPPINYVKYPDHKHLNPGGPLKAKFYLPDTFCYNESPESLGEEGDDPLLEAFDQISIWLFTHQVWIATRNSGKTGVSIGKGVNNLTPHVYANHINPFGKCRCGAEEKYRDCCMLDDIEKSSRTITHYPKNFMHMKPWQQRIGQPQEKALQFLKSQLL